MSGGYPDAPGQRLAYDGDGTWGFHVRVSSNTLSSSYPPGHAKLIATNNESSATAEWSSGRLTPYWVRFQFLEPRDLFGVWVAGDGDGEGRNVFHTLEWSPNSQNWSDGSWNSTGVGTWYSPAYFMDDWRESIRPFSATAAYGFRGVIPGAGGLEFQNRQINQIHLYGAISSSVADRLIVLDKDTGLELSLHDWSWLPRGTTKTKVTQVKNNSSAQADGVGIGFNALMNGNPDSFYTAKDGAGAYSTSLSLGSIAGGVTYANDITVRIVASSTMGMGPHSVRLVASQTGWT